MAVQFFDPLDVAPARRYNLFAGCIVLAILGAAYATFNVVAAVVAQRLHLTATEVTMVANSGILGSWLHITNGAYVARYGPRPTIRVGLVLWLCGFLGMAGAMHGSLPFQSAWHLAALNFIGMHGASFATMAALATVPPLYSAVDRPSMMAALGGTFALGQAFISTVYSVALRNVALEVHFAAIAVLGAVVMLRGLSFFPQQLPAGPPVAGTATSNATNAQPDFDLADSSEQHAPVAHTRHLSNVGVPAGSPVVVPPAPSCCEMAPKAPEPFSVLETQQRDITYIVIVSVSALFFALHMLQLYADLNTDASATQHAVVYVFSITVLGVAGVTFGALPTVTRYFASAAWLSMVGQQPLKTDRAQVVVTPPPSMGSTAVVKPKLVQATGLQYRRTRTAGAREDASSSDRDDEGDPNTNIVPTSEGEAVQEEVHFPAMLGYVDFWLLLVSYLCCGGLASAINSIVSLVVTSLFLLDADKNHARAPSEVLLAAGQLFALGAMGRCWGGLCVGKFTEFARQYLGLSRIAVCLCCHGLSVAAYTLLWFTLSVPALYVTVPLVNFAWGMLYSSSQVVAVETFGTKSFSALWGALSSSPCVSTFVFAMGIAGRMADEQKAHRSVMINGHQMCQGEHCYKGALGWFVVIAYVGLFSMLILAVRRSSISKRS